MFVEITDGPVPRYRQLAEIVAAQIASGELGPNQRVPSETTLVQEYHVSRITVRKAIGVLKERGLVVAVQGVGTFVKGDTE